MLVDAKLTKEIQERANESYRRYKQLEEDISKKIFFAASTGSGCCNYITPYTNENKNHLEKIIIKLQELGYKGRITVFPGLIEMNISW